MSLSAQAQHPAIVTRELRKNYGTVEAVRGLNLEVHHGEVFGLLGPNGAGKTTTLEILEGLRPRSSGAVRVLGIDPAENVRQIKNQIGVCLQATNLPDNIRVIEALDLFSSFYSNSVDHSELLQRLQLWDKRNAFFKTLSGGQKQRVALSLALLNDPKLLFLDEPTTGLDPQVRHEIHALIQDLKDEGRSILLTTHYIEEAERLCDRVAIIDAGKIVEQGTPRDIQERVLGRTLLRFTLDRAVNCESFPEWTAPSHVSLHDSGQAITCQAGEPAAAIVEVVRWLERAGLQLRDIQMRRPTLEDVFIELTGKRLRE